MIPYEIDGNFSGAHKTLFKQVKRKQIFKKIKLNHTREKYANIIMHNKMYFYCAHKFKKNVFHEFVILIH